MPDIIQLLPDSVANQIAAGEVIQRPSSVVKELVENAVDADARNIHVMVVDAGRTSIQVIDDGKGMSETDARLSFERHATSKIRQASDLFDLHTMGFRGEALASIAAVAQVELKTRMATDEIGTHLTISGSRIIAQEPVACPVGSNFNVENLFFNVPARRKFLKSNATELNHILVSFERIVLVNPQISFTFHSNGAETYNLRQGSLRQRIVDVFGKRLNQDLLPLSVQTTVCNISGFVGKPESARKKTPHQFFFVNGRYMKHPYFHKAVQTAFERLVPAGEQVPYFIYFDVPAGDIDVNIHPVKTEIKFENEQSIWQILLAAVRDAIGKFNDVPTIDFDTEGKPDIPVFNPDNGSGAPSVDYDPLYNPFKPSSYQPHSSQKGGQGTSSKDQGFPQGKQRADGWETLYEGLGHSVPSQLDAQLGLFDGSSVTSGTNSTDPSYNDSQSSLQDENSLIDEKSPVHYQYKGRYIMTAVKSGLMIIDQHRASMRILYDGYMQLLQQRTASVQRLLFPEAVHLSPSDASIMERVLPDLARLGFELTSLGGGSYAINGIPAGLEGINPVTLVQEMVSQAALHVEALDQQVFSSLALCLAKTAAIPPGQVLMSEEMDNLVNLLFATSNVNYTPDGHTILCILPQSEIDQRFR